MKIASIKRILANTLISVLISANTITVFAKEADYADRQDICVTEDFTTNLADTYLNEDDFCNSPEVLSDEDITSISAEIYPEEDITTATNIQVITLYPTYIDTIYLNESNYISSQYYNDFINAWNEANFSYTFEYGSKASYSVKGDSVIVSVDGVVVPNPYPYYSYSESTVTVTINGKSSDYTFRVRYFEEDYCIEKTQKFIDENINSSMSDYEKFNKIVSYPASYDYDARYYTLMGILIFGGGDCWASTAIINYLCKQVGIPCHTRLANNDPGAGSGHRNNIALIDGEYYIGDAGYSGEAPRVYMVYKFNIGYSYTSYGEILHYDGFDTDITIPSVIGSTTITTIGTSAFGDYCPIYPTSIVLPDTIVTLKNQAFANIKDIKEITLPQNVSTIGSLAFASCALLENINVAPENKHFSSDNGVLYDKKQTTLLCYPTNGKKEYVIPSTVISIADYSFYATTGIEKITIPANVTSIGKYAFNNSKIKEFVFLGNKPDFCDYAFSSCQAIIYYPAGNSTWDDIDILSSAYPQLKFIASKDNRIAEASLTLTGEIGLNFYLQLTGSASTVTVSSCFRDSITYKVNSLSLTQDGLYKISYPVPAKNISDSVNITVYDSAGNTLKLENESTVNNSYSYSVQDYLDSISSSDKMYNLAAAIKQYGLCARDYFNYNPPVASPTVTAVNLNNYSCKFIFGSLPEGVTYCGSSLLLEDKVTLRHYFSGNIQSFNATGYTDGLAYVDIPDIYPVNFDITQMFFYDNWSIEFSVLTYCYDAIQSDSSNTKLTNLMYSMYWYNKAAKQYFKK